MDLDLLCPECRDAVSRYLASSGTASRTQLQFRLASQLKKKADELMQASERELIQDHHL